MESNMLAERGCRCLLPVFDGKNYNKWTFRLILMLKAKECYKVIEKEEKPEGTTAANWLEAGVKAQNFIVSSIKDNLLDLILQETSAHEMLAELDNLYLSKSTASKVFLRRRLMKLKMHEKKHASKFFIEFESLINEILSCGDTISEDEKLNYLLLSLP